MSALIDIFGDAALMVPGNVQTFRLDTTPTSVEQTTLETDLEAEGNAHAPPVQYTITWIGLGTSNPRVKIECSKK
jgi:hypothetical protein